MFGEANSLSLDVMWGGIYSPTYLGRVALALQDWHNCAIPQTPTATF
jgi:hypothetical protein